MGLLLGLARLGLEPAQHFSSLRQHVRVQNVRPGHVDGQHRVQRVRVVGMQSFSRAGRRGCQVDEAHLGRNAYRVEDEEGTVAKDCKPVGHGWVGDTCARVAAASTTGETQCKVKVANNFGQAPSQQHRGVENARRGGVGEGVDDGPYKHQAAGDLHGCCKHGCANNTCDAY